MGRRDHGAARPLVSELGPIRPDLDDLVDSFVLGEEEVVRLGDGRRDESGGREVSVTDWQDGRWEDSRAVVIRYVPPTDKVTTLEEANQGFGRSEAD